MIEDLELFKGPLKEIMEKELAVGNEIKEIWHGDWPYEGVVVVSLKKPFLVQIEKELPDVEFRNINDIHYWKAEYYDKKYNMMLICSFASPDDLKYEF